jgi:hypothetical protein
MQKENQYWIHRDGQNFGPYFLSQILQFLDEGRFSSDDLCCEQGSQQWGKITDFVVTSNPTPPPPVPTPKKPTQLDPKLFSLSYRKSWTAFIMPCLVWFFLSFGISEGELTILLFSLIFWGIPISLWILSIRKYLLYTDTKGVWLSYGLFPWTKGVKGVLWRDLNECVFVNSFFGWLFKSYKVKASHRFTKSSEIAMSHTRNGKQAIVEINGLHHKFLGMKDGEARHLEG